MYPETSNYTNDTQTIAKRKRLLLSVAALFVLFAIIMIAIFLLRPHDKEYTLTKTDLKSQQNFGHLSGNDLYSFNGLAFTKTDIQTNKTTVLSSGQRLPIPSAIYWAGSKGALLNFSSSFAFTPVESALNAMGEQLSYNGNDYTWYLDFSSNKLSLVSKSPLVASLATYSSRDEGFYYVPDIRDQDGTSTSLHFFDIAAVKDKTVAKDLLLTDTTALQPGKNEKSVYIIARDLADTKKKKLYSIDQTGKKTLVTEGDKIFLTNTPDAFVITKADDTPVASGEEEDESEVPDEPAYLYKVSDKSLTPLQFTAGAANMQLYIADDSQFFAVKGNSSNADGEAVYYSGKINGTSATATAYPYQYDDRTKLAASQITKINGYSDDGHMLVTTLDDQQLLFGNALPDSSVATSKTLQDATKIVDACVSQGAQSEQYFNATRAFQISLTADGNFTKNIARFSKCIVEKDSAVLLPYSFQFVGLDPVNGRISTD